MLDDIATAAPFIAAPARRRPLVVIGNGPSLRGFDFFSLDGADTLGMNAAYRYWREIDWRPTHYACLDDALIDTHHAEIRALMEEGRIETAFVTGRYLDHHPAAAADPRFFFLDQFIAHWHLERGAAFGLAYEESRFFKSGDPSKLTTGAYSVRFGAHLGYARIALIGIDLVYQNLPQANALDGNRLRLAAAPGSNPNYFFDDYQQPGDEYHVPNPQEHGANLHAQSFRVLRNDFIAADVETEVWNANPKSLLSLEAILPYAPLDRFLGRPALTSVLVPVTAGEREQAVDNLWLWAQPAFFPFLGAPPTPAPVLVFVFNNDEAAAAQGDILQAYAAQPALRRCFSDIRFVNLALKGDSDRYERDDKLAPGAEGRRAGPNNMFFGGLKAVADLPGYTLWLETDCTPIRANWLGRANELLAAGEAPWIVGSFYRGADPIGTSERRHINGNALYAAGEESFREFVEAIWKPQLAKLVKFRPDTAFDCVLESLFDLAQPAKPSNRIWRFLQESSARFRYADYIQNIVDGVTKPAEKADQLERILIESPDSYLVHSRLVARHVGALRRADASMEPTDLIALMRGESLPDPVPVMAGLSEALAAAAPPPSFDRRDPNRPSLTGCARWSATLIWRRRLPVALGLAVAFIAAGLAVVFADGSRLELFLLFAVLGLLLAAGALGALAFLYLATHIIVEGRRVEQLAHVLRAAADNDLAMCEERLSRRVSALETRKADRSAPATRLSSPAAPPRKGPDQ